MKAKNRFCTKTRFETEALGNSKMANWRVVRTLPLVDSTPRLVAADWLIRTRDASNT